METPGEERPAGVGQPPGEKKGAEAWDELLKRLVAEGKVKPAAKRGGGCVIVGGLPPPPKPK